MKRSKYFSFLLVLCLFQQTFAQQSIPNSNGVFQKIEEKSIVQSGNRMLTPRVYTCFELNIDLLKNQLATVTRQEGAFIYLPTASGTTEQFKVIENNTMHPEYAAKFTEIRTFDVRNVKNLAIWGKIDLTPQGFHGMIFEPNKSTLFVDPYFFSGPDKTIYQVYLRSDYDAEKSFTCHYQTESIFEDKSTQEFIPMKSFSTCEARNYRLALSATGEYTVFHGGTKVLAAAAQVTTMNRVNAIYTKEFATTLTIIPNNDTLIYVNPGTDPFTNGATNIMINQNQSLTNSLIGSANYDIGHVFGTNSGGLAGFGVVCNNSNKASGVTGSGTPINDPFDVDYVAHEMGHQFRANHTFNNSCSGNRSNSTAWEPGSGTTIMAYAGICAPDIQSNSDDHFHGKSLEEIGNFITGNNHTCAVKTPISNSAPNITSVASSTIYLPISTPFALTALATDDDGDAITYGWEQINTEISTQAPLATSTGGPNFRSISPSTSPTRYLPNLNALINGTPTTWEVLPSVSRNMRFRVSVRDNNPSGTCTDYADVNLSFVSSAGPFVVTYPSNTGIVWPVGSTQTITWNVANTQVAPIACANVDIKISYDNGVTFTTLVANTPNDGNQSITVPNMPSYNAIIMVMCQSGTFFDVSDNVFYIIQGNCQYPQINQADSIYGLCIGGTVNLSLTNASLNDATSWNWYSGSCGTTLIGTGTSITVGVAGTYYVRGEGGCIQVPSGCKPFVVQNVNFNGSIYQSTQNNQVILTANQNGASYQWYNCATNQAIPGATAQTYLPSSNGSYKAVITYNSCSKESACLEVKTVGVSAIDDFNISISPNPSEGIFTIKLDGSLKMDQSEVRDINGKLIQFQYAIEDGSCRIDLSGVSGGVYFLHLKVNEVNYIYKLLKN